jgi:hypothetical protein
MSIFNWIGDLFGGANKIIDNLHTSDEEKLKLRNELGKIKAQMHEKSVSLMTAEVKSDHFIVAAWRPLCVLMLIGLIIADAYGVASAPEQIYDLANLFLTTYAGGRSLEKITKAIKK